jgi:hypothetical protein
VQEVVKQASIYRREYWLFTGRICIYRLYWGFLGLFLEACRSVRGFLEQFAAVQACRQASLLVSRIAVFSALVFRPWRVGQNRQVG